MRTQFSSFYPVVLRNVPFWQRWRMDLDAEAREFLRAIRRRINSLPREEQLNALLKFVSVMLDYLTHEQVLTIRAEMIATYGEQNLSEALNLLDGHLALRELQGNSPDSES